MLAKIRDILIIVNKGQLNQYIKLFPVSNNLGLNLSFKEQTAILYDNVNYKSNFSHLIADKILIDFFNKNTKILMNDKNNNILVRSILSNGNN